MYESAKLMNVIRAVQALSGQALTGAMTYSFIQAAQNEPGLTYGRLLSAMRTTIREAKTGIRLKGPIASLVNKILRTELSQVYIYVYIYTHIYINMLSGTYFFYSYHIHIFH